MSSHAGWSPERLRRWRGPVTVVLCTETDDYACPRGATIPGRYPFVFAAYLAGGDWGQARVSEGKTYAVDADGILVAEMLDVDGGSG